MRKSTVIASAVACLFSTGAFGQGNKPFNPFLRAGQPISEVPANLRGLAPAIEVRTFEDAFEDSILVYDPTPSRATVHDFVEPIPERGPSYRPRTAPVALRAPAPTKEKRPAAIASVVTPQSSLAVIPLAPAERAAVPTPVTDQPAPVASRAAPYTPSTVIATLQPPLDGAPAISTVTLEAVSAPAVSVEEQLALERAERNSRCKDVLYLGKQLAVIPPTSTTFKLPFKGLRGCLSAMGAKEPWIEIVDSRSDELELFAEENLTSTNRRAVIMVMTPTESIEVKVMQRKYDLQEKTPPVPETLSRK